MRAATVGAVPARDAQISGVIESLPLRELTMSHTQAAEYKFEIARINKELIEVKKKFYEQRKREQAIIEQRRAERTQPVELLVQEARSTLNRFTGGGFNLNMPAS